MPIYRSIIIALIFSISVVSVVAQEITATTSPTHTPTRAASTLITTPIPTITPTEINVSYAVTATAEDGLTLVGDFYFSAPEHPTLILLHQLYTDRTSWTAYSRAMHSVGVNILAVDLRGHGATGGKINWGKAVDDVSAWVNWLRLEGQVIGNISIAGSSMGSNLALVSCANLECYSAIAISPGWSYYGVHVQTALQTNRQSVIIYAERDRYPALGVPKMRDIANAGTEFIEFEGNSHGMNLLAEEAQTILPQILAALN